MKVYELIQELAQYSADTEVRFHLKGEFDTDVEAEFNRENENDVQDVTVTAEFDDDVDFDDIDDHERDRYQQYIQINLSYQKVRNRLWQQKTKQQNRESRTHSWQ